MSSQHTSPLTLEAWAGSENLNLTLVFTDIVDSTLIGRKLGDRRWIEDLFIHFSQARSLTDFVDCFVVKVIGDSLMMAFRASTDAVDFALAFLMDTGVGHIGIRVGINSGQVQIRENDIYGLNVNLTARVQHLLPAEGIVVTKSVRQDYENRFGTDSGVRFVRRDVDLKSFGKQEVHHILSASLRNTMKSQRQARETLLGISKPTAS
jgi:class 3 adenylate cyclase